MNRRRRGALANMLRKKIIVNPEFKDAPYEYAFCDSKGENIQEIPEEMQMFRFNDKMEKVYRLIEITEYES